MATMNGTASSMADQVKVIFDAGRELLLGKAEDAKERIVDAGATVKDKLGDAKVAVTDRGGTALSLSRRVIKQHPLIAVGLAFGVGYIAMRIAR